MTSPFDNISVFASGLAQAAGLRPAAVHPLCQDPDLPRQAGLKRLPAIANIVQDIAGQERVTDKFLQFLLEM